MERSHTPLNIRFWGAYLVTSQTPGVSAVQFQRQLGISRYETAFQILHKLRGGMPPLARVSPRPSRNNILLCQSVFGSVLSKPENQEPIWLI